MLFSKYLFLAPDIISNYSHLEAKLKKKISIAHIVFASIDPDSFTPKYFPFFNILMSGYLICVEIIYKPIFHFSWC